MLRELYLHPNGQLPAYEWNFSDVNPPVHAWATLLVYETELEQRGEGDVAWLKSAFQKLLVNFTWWINRKDPTGRNVFEGGFLGLDNIGVFDRSAPLPTGGRLEQSDGTAWMAFFAQCMLGIAVELSRHDPMYEDMVLKFAEHFVFIAAAMDRIGDNQDELWDEEDGFFYDVLRLPDGSAQRLKVRSMVGLLPLCATTILPERRRHDQRRPAGPAAAPHRGDARAARHHPRRPRARRERPADAGRARRDEAAPDPRPDARRGRVPQPARAARRCRAYHADAPVPLRRPRPDVRGALPARRVRQRHVRRQLELAGTGVVPGQLPPPARAAAPLRLLRRRVQGRVPDRLGTALHAVRGGPGARPPPGVDLRPRRATAAAPSTAAPRRSRATRTGRTCCCSTSTSTATTAPGSAPATRPGGPASSPGSSRCLGYLRPEDVLSDALNGNLVYRPPSSREPMGVRPGHLRAQHRRLAPRRRHARPARSMTLADVPDEEWDRVTPAGVDAVWLMGVWERSPEGVRLALDVADARRRVPTPRSTTSTPADVIGSAYCIRRYEVDARFGGRAGLAAARAALAARGVRLLVDFVPNHVAPDHPWLSAHPEYFVRGDADDLGASTGRASSPSATRSSPAGATRTSRRGPTSPSSTRSPPGCDSAAIDTLIDIGDARRRRALRHGDADAQRRVPPHLGRTGRAAARHRVLDRRDRGRPSRHPRLLFIAEAYWDLEWQLQQLGFDYCYDKRLYDRLLHDGAAAVRGHLGADIDYQRRLVRFIENHDEPRAASELPAAARTGGRGRRSPPCPARRSGTRASSRAGASTSPCSSDADPPEPVDDELRAFHLTLVAVAHDLRRGDWALCAATGWPDNAAVRAAAGVVLDRRESSARSSSSTTPTPRRPPWSTCRGPTSPGARGARRPPQRGRATSATGDDLATSGLYVGLDARAFHVLRWTPIEE